MRNRPDKRVFNRLNTRSYSIEYKVNDDDVIFKADVLNISAGGICFLRASILDRGDKIQIKFQFHSKKIIINGEVIRIEGREAAVKFVDDENKIERFVEYFNTDFLKVKGKNNTIEQKDDFVVSRRDEKSDILDLD